MLRYPGLKVITQQQCKDVVAELNCGNAHHFAQSSKQEVGSCWHLNLELLAGVRGSLSLSPRSRPGRQVSTSGAEWWRHSTDLTFVSSVCHREALLMRRHGLHAGHCGCRQKACTTSRVCMKSTAVSCTY
jgi:hypothetical protein